MLTIGLQPMGFPNCFDHKPLIMKEEYLEKNNYDVTEIIEKVLQAVGMNAPEFSRTIDVNYQRIYDLQRGRIRKFTPGLVNKITTKFPNINKFFLYTGDGDVLLEEKTPQPKKPARAKEEHNAEITALYTKILSLLEQVQSTNTEIFDKNAELLLRESELNERERRLNELEVGIRRRELELENLARELGKEA